MVLPQVFRKIPSCRRRQHQQAVDHQQSHPAQGHGHHHGNDQCKQRLYRTYLNAPAMGQIGMQHRQKQSVGADAPNHRHGQQNQGQNADFRRARRTEYRR